MKIKKIVKFLFAGRSLFNPVEGNRWLVEGMGYKVDRRITWGVLLLIIGLAWMIAAQNDYDFQRHYYVNCSVGICENPFYMQCSELWCYEEYLYAPFVTGEMMKGNFRDFEGYAAFLILLGFLLNHFIYNRSFKLKDDDEETSHNKGGNDGKKKRRR